MGIDQPTPTDAKLLLFNNLWEKDWYLEARQNRTLAPELKYGKAELDQRKNFSIIVLEGILSEDEKDEYKRLLKPLEIK